MLGSEANHQQLSLEMLAIYLMLDFAGGLFNPEITRVWLFIGSASNLTFSKRDQMISNRNQFNSYIFLLQN